MRDFGPKQIAPQDIAIQSLGAFIAGILGSLIILGITFFLSGAFDIAGTFESSSAGLVETGSIFPLILSLVTLIGTSSMIFLSYFFLGMSSPDYYKRSGVIFAQIAFFTIITYICLTPIYIYVGMQSYQNIMYMFIVHALIMSFGTSLLAEILNNYRYVLIGVYGSFLGLFAASFLSLLLFSSLPTGTAKLLALIILLPTINLSITLLKNIFEWIYYRYYLATTTDPLGDIFSQVEQEENEALQLQEEKNLLQ